MSVCPWQALRAKSNVCWYVRSLPIVEHLKSARGKHSRFLQTLKITDVKSFMTFCYGSIPVKNFYVVYACNGITPVKIYLRWGSCVNI